MFTRDDEYEAPEYHTAMFLGAGHAMYCSFCGALVLNQLLHDEWHAQLWVALKKEK